MSGGKKEWITRWYRNGEVIHGDLVISLVFGLICALITGLTTSNRNIGLGIGIGIAIVSFITLSVPE